jgi:hypothetical protein
VFVRRSKYDALEAKAIKTLNARDAYQLRLTDQENAFPIAKRELCDELIPYLRSRFKPAGDWRSPDIPEGKCDQEIRRLLARIEEVEGNYVAAVGGLNL